MSNPPANFAASTFDFVKIRRQLRQLKTVAYFSAILFCLLVAIGIGLYWALINYGYDDQIKPAVQAFLNDPEMGTAYQSELDKLAARYNFDVNNADSLYRLLFMRPDATYAVFGDVQKDVNTLNTAITALKTAPTLIQKIDIILQLDHDLNLNYAPIKAVVNFANANPDIISFLRANPNLDIATIIYLATFLQSNKDLVSFLQSNPDITLSQILDVIKTLKANPDLVGFLKSNPTIDLNAALNLISALKNNPDVLNFLRQNPNIDLSKVTQLIETLKSNGGLSNFLKSNPNMNMESVINLVVKLHNSPVVLALLQGHSSIVNWLLKNVAGVDVGGVNNLDAILDTIMTIDANALQNLDLGNLTGGQLQSIIDSLNNINLDMLKSLNLGAMTGGGLGTLANTIANINLDSIKNVDLSGLSGSTLQAVLTSIDQIDLSAFDKLDLSKISATQFHEILSAILKINIDDIKNINVNATNQLETINMPITKQTIDQGYQILNLGYGIGGTIVAAYVLLYLISGFRITLYVWPGISVSRWWGEATFALLPFFWIATFAFIIHMNAKINKQTVFIKNASADVKLNLNA